MATRRVTAVQRKRGIRLAAPKRQRRRVPGAQKHPRPGQPWRDQGYGLGNIRAPGANGAGCWNEGVGEHVRTRFHFGAFAPVKLRTPLGDPHRTKKNLFLLPDRFWRERTLSEMRSSRLT